MLLSDATARYDDLNEGQLGDVLFEDGRTIIAIFGSKCDRGCAGEPVAMPARLGRGFARGFGAVRHGAVHHDATVRGIPEVLEFLACGFAAAGQGRHPRGPAVVATWPAAVATWPAEVRALAPRL